MAKQRVHTLTIKVTFNKACSAAVALREVRDTIHGQFYTTPTDDTEPDTYRVKSIGRRTP